MLDSDAVSPVERAVRWDWWPSPLCSSVSCSCVPRGKCFSKHLMLWLLLLCDTHRDASTCFLSSTNVPKSLLLAGDFPQLFASVGPLSVLHWSLLWGSDGREVTESLSSPTIEARANKVLLRPNQSPCLSAILISRIWVWLGQWSVQSSPDDQRVATFEDHGFNQMWRQLSQGSAPAVHVYWFWAWGFSPCSC